jgi:hypothetical protein
LRLRQRNPKSSSRHKRGNYPRESGETRTLGIATGVPVQVPVVLIRDSNKGDPSPYTLVPLASRLAESGMGSAPAGTGLLFIRDTVSIHLQEILTGRVFDRGSDLWRVEPRKKWTALEKAPRQPLAVIPVPVQIR